MGLGGASVGAFPVPGPGLLQGFPEGGPRARGGQGLWAELPALGKPRPEGQTLAFTFQGATLHPTPFGHSAPKTRVAEGPRSLFSFLQSSVSEWE